MSLFKNLVKKIKSSSAFNYLSKLFVASSKWDCEQLKKNIQDLLVQLDFALELAQNLANETVQSLSKNSSITPDLVKNRLIESLTAHYRKHTSESQESFLKIKKNQCNVFFIIGSNGVGKTSFIAKLVHYLKVQNSRKEKILLVASDTFRAGAIEQLKEWSSRLGVEIEVPRGKESSCALIYRTLQNSSDYDLVICDSSGRQYNNKNLLVEIQKQYSIIKKLLNKSPEEIFLVVDSTLGIYSHSELQKILDYVPITGLVLTKMDSTTRGGAIYNLKPKFFMPIKFICFGEKEQDIDEFDISSVTSQLVNTVFSEELIKSQ